ncbi:MAG: DUF308 domain-containing protein [Puia sp.]|nr:DUF308 domain-containing protein [Puia sp.]
MTLVSTAVRSIKNWWWFIIKGILFIIAGVAVLSRPVEGYLGLSVLFSMIILGIGISQLVFSIGNRQSLPGWGWTLASGIIDIAIGVYLLLFPILTMATLPFFVGFWLLFRAFYIMGMSFDLSNLQASGWGWLLAGGILLAILSLLILYYPAAGIIGIVGCSGSAFIVAGIATIAMAFKFRDIKEKVKGLV